MEEHNIVLDEDIIVGNHSDIRYGIIADSVIIGERVSVSGDVLARSDIRIDIWSKIGGNVRCGENGYIGEFVKIDGKLFVNGDLDVGNDVKINRGFEAHGWIVVRNPVPVITYIFLYISELLRMGKGEEVERAMSEFFEEEAKEISYGAMVVPNGSRISADSIRVPGTATIGNNCRLVGNIRAESLEMGDATTLYGSIRTASDIEIGENNAIHGNIVSRGRVIVGKGTHILGEINAYSIRIHEDSRVDGVMRATGGTTFIREEEEVAQDRELIKLDVADQQQ
ncbi:acyltransferase [Methanohalophilus mahii]|uniref:Acyltransferase n=1 Tax=Methanohalophilus mahii (strain ATCC 35705 / DSM 5219 / SLP) TaxID=547558 RepID=D5E9W9_METMS|nr:acyltransferase [Methanohalophilus mahii]ADE35970.1 acyltransferase [Methanohalophilus mahii DSM 5219]